MNIKSFYLVGLLSLTSCAFPVYPTEDRPHSPRLVDDLSLEGDAANDVRELDVLLDTIVVRICAIEDEVNRLSRNEQNYSKTAGVIALLGVTSAYMNDNLGGSRSSSVTIGIWTSSISGLMLATKDQVVKSGEYIVRRQQKHRTLTRIYDDTLARYGLVRPLLISGVDSLFDKGDAEVKTLIMRMRLALNQSTGE